MKDALRLGAIGYDAVKHLVLCRIERRPPKLDLDIYPYLPRANVATTAAVQLYQRSLIRTMRPFAHAEGHDLPWLVDEVFQAWQHSATMSS